MINVAYKMIIDTINYHGITGDPSPANDHYCSLGINPGLKNYQFVFHTGAGLV